MEAHHWYETIFYVYIYTVYLHCGAWDHSSHVIEIHGISMNHYSLEWICRLCGVILRYPRYPYILWEPFPKRQGHRSWVMIFWKILLHEKPTDGNWYCVDVWFAHISSIMNIVEMDSTNQQQSNFQLRRLLNRWRSSRQCHKCDKHLPFVVVVVAAAAVVLLLLLFLLRLRLLLLLLLFLLLLLLLLLLRLRLLLERVRGLQASPNALVLGALWVLPLQLGLYPFGCLVVPLCPPNVCHSA